MASEAATPDASAHAAAAAAAQDKPEWEPFAVNFVNLTLTAGSQQTKEPDNVDLRKDILAKLDMIVEDRLAWSDTVIQNLYWDRHAKIKEQIAQVHALIETTANAFKNGPKADTSAGAFYDVFQSESKELIKLCCQAYGIGLRVFLEAVELDLNVVLGDMANLPQQKEGQSILGLIPDIAAYYSQYTTKLALLIESVRLTSIQITIDQGIRDEIVNFADAFDIENGMIADTINDMIRAGSAEEATEKYQEIKKHYADIKVFADDLSTMIKDKIGDISKKDIYVQYINAVNEALSCFNSSKKLFESELANVDLHGAFAQLQRKLSRRNSTASLASSSAEASAPAPVPPADVAEAAKQVDGLEKSLEKINFILSFPENVNDVAPVIEELLPTLRALPQKTTAIATTNLKSLIEQNTVYVQKAVDFELQLESTLQTVREAKGDVTKLKAAIQSGAGFTAAFANISAAFNPASSPTLFENDHTRQLMTKGQYLQDYIVALQKNLSKAPAEVELTSTLEDINYQLEDYVGYFKRYEAIQAEAIAAEKKVLTDVKDKTAEFVRVATRNLCDSANTLLAEGFEGGRNWPMLEACRSLSMFVDVATQMVAAAEANAAAAAAAASAPVPAPATGASEAGDDDTLPNVRTLYHLPQNSNYNPNDDNIEEPKKEEPVAPKIKRTAKGNVLSKVYQLEDSGKDKAPEILQGQFAKLGLGKDKSGKVDPSLCRVLKEPEAKVVESFGARNQTSLWTDKGKALTDIDPATGEIDVKSASLNQILILATSPEQVEKSYKFQATFWLTHSTFIDPLLFINKLAERYTVPPAPSGADAASYNLAFKYPIQLRVCDILKQWFSKRGHDDLATKPAVLQALNKFLEGAVTQESKMIAQNLQRTQQMYAKTDRYIANEKWSQNAGQSIYKQLKVIGAPIFQGIADVFDARRAAINITYADSIVFKALNLEEFANQKWLRPNAATSAPILTELRTQTNRMACFVAKTILLEPNVRVRRKIINRFVGMGAKFLRLRNFHSMFGVVAGLKTPAVLRLKQTWGEVSPGIIQQLEDMHALMNPDNNFAAYRAAYAEALQPRIPFMGVVLYDLFKIEQAYNDTILAKMGQGLVDWTSRDEIASKVLETLVNDQNECNYRLKDWSDPILRTSVLNAMDEYACPPSELKKLSLAAESSIADSQGKRSFISKILDTLKK